MCARSLSAISGPSSRTTTSGDGSRLLLDHHDALPSEVKTLLVELGRRVDEADVRRHPRVSFPMTCPLLLSQPASLPTAS